MKRFSLASMLWAAVAATTFSFTLSPPVQASGSVAAPGTYDVGGTVTAINWWGGYVVVQTQKGCYQVIYPDSSTVVTLNGAPATINDIAVGNRIRSSNSLTALHALTIDLR